MGMLAIVGAALVLVTGADWWDSSVEASLKRAPERRTEWVKMLRSAPSGHRTTLSYLVAHLPVGDLRGLSPAALAENTRLAIAARESTAWSKKIPQAIFLDAVAPHASVTEPRQPMRAEFMRRYMPLVKDAKSSGEAALRLNKTLFKDYKVTYNTRRLRTDQSSPETIAQGMATCTGLSIMLVEACRAVGVPARVAGIHSWPGRGGNHTWVEVWDAGRWHYVGAAEPDEKGLNHAWFTGDAAKAIKAVPKNAIYAVTYRPTGDRFPLAWDPDTSVSAENVTDRYTGSAKPAGPRLMVEVKSGGTRVEADVTALNWETGEAVMAGRSLGPQADINLHLSAPVPTGTRYLIVARYGGREQMGFALVNGDTVVRVSMEANLDYDEEIAELLADRFGAPEKRARAQRLLAEIPYKDSLRRAAWNAYAASIKAPLQAELDAKQVKTADRTSPFLWRKVGEKPGRGWGLVIAMHGGGATTKEFNDQQWQSMFRRYREAPGQGYIYVSLRAPNDTWNGFYDDAISPMIQRLIQIFTVCEDVNPNRVVTLGASHGGYGAFVIGTKIPDRFAAVHASASAPTDGETKGENLRNVRFTYMIGENDTAYGRAERCQAFEKRRQDWIKDFGGFNGALEFLPGVGHQVPDQGKLAEMFGFVRDVAPKRVVWRQSDDVLKDFYWIECSKPVDDGFIDATASDNFIRVKADMPSELALWINPGLVDLTKPIRIKVNEQAERTVNVRPSFETLCLGMERRGDPLLAAPVRVRLRG